MKVAVTGGSGFLGQHVVTQLLQRGHTVRIIDRVPPRVAYGPQAEYWYDDLEDVNSLWQAFKGQHIVMHLAAIANTNQAFADPVLCVQVNSVGTLNVYEAARNAGVSRVVLAGSTLVSGAFAGDVLEDPYPEEAWFDLRLACHPYVVSKIHAEMIAKSYAEHYDVESTVFRYGIQYGRSMSPGVVAHAFITNGIAGNPLNVFGTGDQWRQYTHVEDIAAAHALVAEDLKDEHIGTFHLCGEEKVTINKMAEVVAELTGVKIVHGPTRGDDIPVKWCANDKVKEALGWKPTISLEDGLADAVNWYKDNPTLWTGPEKVTDLGR